HQPPRLLSPARRARPPLISRSLRTRGHTRPIEIRHGLVQAAGTDAVRKHRIRMFGDVTFDLLPVIVLGPDALAVAANRQEPGEALDVGDEPEGTLPHTNPRPELVRIERLRKVVVCAGL